MHNLSGPRAYAGGRSLSQRDGVDPAASHDGSDPGPLPIVFYLPTTPDIDRERINVLGYEIAQGEQGEIVYHPQLYRRTEPDARPYSEILSEDRDSDFALGPISEEATTVIRRCRSSLGLGPCTIDDIALRWDDQIAMYYQSGIRSIPFDEAVDWICR